MLCNPALSLYCYWCKYEQATAHAQWPRIAFWSKQCWPAYLVLNCLTAALPAKMKKYSVGEAESGSDENVTVGTCTQS